MAMAAESTTYDAPSRTSNENASPLLQLPRELRDWIYDITFAGAVLWLPEHDPLSSPESTGLILANKQLYSETIDVYYRHLTIVTHFPMALVNWAQQIPLPRLRQVPSVKLHLSKSTAMPVAKIMLDQIAKSLRKKGVAVERKAFAVKYGNGHGVEVIYS